MVNLTINSVVNQTINSVVNQTKNYKKRKDNGLIVKLGLLPRRGTIVGLTQL